MANSRKTTGFDGLVWSVASHFSDLLTFESILPDQAKGDSNSGGRQKQVWASATAGGGGSGGGCAPRVRVAARDVCYRR